MANYKERLDGSGDLLIACLWCKWRYTLSLIAIRTTMLGRDGLIQAVKDSHDEGCAGRGLQDLIVEDGKRMVREAESEAAEKELAKLGEGDPTVHKLSHDFILADDVMPIVQGKHEFGYVYPPPPRADRNTVCSYCEIPYWSHPEVDRTEDRILVALCDGGRAHLEVAK